jgi:hypothetical protein
MDPLSVVGSIAGIISLADVVFRKLFHYVQDIKNAEKEARDLKNEVAALSGVLHNLQLVARDLEADHASSYVRTLACCGFFDNICLMMMYGQTHIIPCRDTPNVACYMFRPALVMF